MKAVYQHLGGEARGHQLSGLLRGLSDRLKVPKGLYDQVAELEKHYISARDPDAFTEGPPFRHYAAPEARRAIKYAEAVLRFCGGHVA